MKNILILGTCASRDIFNYQEAHDKLKLCDYFARSSLISIFSNPLEASQYADLENISSKFRKRCVIRDFDKSFTKKVGSCGFDILLTDFLDERLNLWLAAPDSYVTVSDELIEGNPEINDRLIIEGLSSRKIRLWEESWKRFMQLSDEKEFHQKVYINKLYLTSKGFHGLRKGIFSSRYIREVNDFLEELYGIAKQYVPVEQIIEYPSGLLRTNPKHRWGKGPYHYIDDVYLYLIDFLSRI